MSDTPKDLPARSRGSASAKAGWLDRVYESRTLDESEESYDGCAAGHGADLPTAGYRLPAVANGLAGRHLPAGTAVAAYG